MRSKYTNTALTLGFLCLAFCSLTARVAQAQDRRVLSKTVWASELSAGHEVRVALNGTLLSNSDLNQLVVTLAAVPSGQLLDYTGIKLRLDDDVSGSLIIVISRLNSPDDLDRRVKIAVLIPTNEDSQTQMKQEREAAQLIALRGLYNRFLDSIEAAAKARIAYTKTSRERNLYISGGYKGGEISANRAFPIGNVWRLRSLLNQIDLGLSLDKGSGRTSDPDFLDIGANFRKIFPLHRQSMAKEINSLLDKAMISTATLNATASDQAKFIQSADYLDRATRRTIEEVDKQEPAFFRAIVLTPLAPRLETSLRGHQAGFLINFVNSSDIQIRTGTVPVLGSSHFTWDMKVNPLALEAGTVIRNPDDPSRKGSPIARLNAGASGKLTYNFKCGDDVIVNRIEFEVKGINRHLFNDESAFNATTQKAAALVRGNKYAAEADFRFVFGLRIPIKYFNRHPAVTVSYKNGFFPPLYAYNNSVSVHFTFETDNDSSFKDMSLHIGDIERLRKSVNH
jgi:hypothetical protein